VYDYERISNLKYDFLLGDFSLLVRHARLWKECARSFLFSRLLLLLATILVMALVAGRSDFPFERRLVSIEAMQHRNPLDPLAYLLAWWRWDTLFYIRIAAEGYSASGLTAFFPLWPFLVHLVGWPLTLLIPNQIPYFLASILLSNLFFYASLLLFSWLTEQEFGADVARRGVWMLSFFPYTLFFSTGYTESLFLFLSLAVFFFLRRGEGVNWWLASLCALLAASTRETGFVIAVPFLVYFVRRYWPFWSRFRTQWHFMLNALLAMSMVPVGVIAYMVFLAIAWKDPLHFLHAAIAWERVPTFPGGGLLFSLWYLVTLQVPLYSLVNNLPDLVFTLLPIIVLFRGWRRLPLHYSLFSLAMLLFSLSTMVAFPNPLMSIPRYLMVIFPVFMLYGIEHKHPLFQRIAQVAFPILLMAGIGLFVFGRWVA
jgi:hypothetical protein